VSQQVEWRRVPMLWTGTKKADNGFSFLSYQDSRLSGPDSSTDNSRLPGFQACDLGLRITPLVSPILRLLDLA
jgi:hypothetical protein